MNEVYETVCSICLEPCIGKAFTNPCLHEFCYTCILKWSEVKPECPLCKRLLISVFHNITGDDKYDEQLIPQAKNPLACPTAQRETNNRVADAPSVVPQSPSENYLQWLLSNTGYYHYCRICYRPYFSAHDLTLHFHNDHYDSASRESRAVTTSRTPYAQQNANENTITSRIFDAQQRTSTSNEPVFPISPNTFRATSQALTQGQSSAYECNVCGKICASGAGLASHMRAHSRRGESSRNSLY